MWLSLSEFYVEKWNWKKNNFIYWVMITSRDVNKLWKNRMHHDGLICLIDDQNTESADLILL